MSLGVSREALRSTIFRGPRCPRAFLEQALWDRDNVVRLEGYICGLLAARHDLADVDLDGLLLFAGASQQTDPLRRGQGGEAAGLDDGLHDRETLREPDPAWGLDLSLQVDDPGDGHDDRVAGLELHIFLHVAVLDELDEVHRDDLIPA